MRRRQTIPRQWLIVDRDLQSTALRRLSRGSGLLLLHPPQAPELRYLRQIARLRAFEISIEMGKDAVRVHNLRELRRARLDRVRLILLSPLFETRSHPDWKPIPRMRAAALARLGNRRLIALGGMNQRRFAKVAPLGFIGWAGISAFKI